MYIQKRKTLEDRINQVVHKMTSDPENELVASIHLRSEEGEEKELPADKIRNKRERIIRVLNHRKLSRTDAQKELIALYEQLIVLEDAEQLETDEARFKQLRLQYQLNLDSLLLKLGGYITNLLSQNEKRTSDQFDYSDEFSPKRYFLARSVEHTEDRIALYNRGVEESRNELKVIARRYSSDVLNRWENEFLAALEEERRQLRMTLN